MSWDHAWPSPAAGDVMGELWDTAGTGQGHGDVSTRHTRAAPGHPKGAQGLQNALGGARHSPGQGMEGTRAAPSMVCGVNAMGSKSLVPPSRVSARPRCAPLAHGRTPGPVLLLPGKRGVAVMEHRDPAWDNDDPWPSSSSSSSSPGFQQHPPPALHRAAAEELLHQYPGLVPHHRQGLFVPGVLQFPLLSSSCCPEALPRCF